MKLFIQGIILCFSISFTQAQSNSEDLKFKLNFYGDAMINTLDDENKAYASKQFYGLFKEYCEEQPRGLIDFSFLKFLLVLNSPDSTVALVSWQVKYDEAPSDYYGFVFQDQKSMIELNRATGFDRSFQYEEQSADDWYGALYYNMLPYKDNKFLVFGFKTVDRFTNAKLVDVMDLASGSAKFGEEIFQDKEDSLVFNSKLLIEYSADAKVNLNYNPGLGMIVHDHLMKRMGQLPNQGPTNMPDGTYEGYELKDGMYRYNEKLFDHSYGENNAPRPKPVLNTNRKLKKK